jgi:hypothetical protein
LPRALAKAGARSNVPAKTANFSAGYVSAILNGWRGGEFFGFDMSGNVASANNFIRAGYRMFQPHDPWAFPNTLYWRKIIDPLPSVHSTHLKRP